VTDGQRLGSDFVSPAGARASFVFARIASQSRENRPRGGPRAIRKNKIPRVLHAYFLKATQNKPIAAPAAHKKD
jgi:hypothetical protein